MSTLGFPSRTPFKAYMADPFEQVGEMVGGRLVNVMGNHNRSLAAIDPIESSLYPMVWFVHGIPVAGIDIPQHLAIV